MSCLKNFYESLGQSISLQKSNLAFSKGVDENLASHITAIAQIPAVTILGKYIGLPFYDGKG